MINFTVSSAGQTLINNATAGSNPVIIDSIDLKNSQGGIVYTVTENEFAGAVVADSSNLGDYIVFQFEDSRTNSYTVASIEIKSGTTVVATSETISLTKSANSIANFRISAQFAGASKCGCKNTNINLPYATQYRDGIIRLARSSDEAHKDRTVYSAADVETLIAAGVDGANKYVPWNVSSGEPVEGSTTVSHLAIVDDYTDEQTAVTFHTQYNSVDNVTYLYIDGPTGGDGTYIIGSVVTSSPTISSGSLVGSQTLVNENYISELYSNTVLDNSNLPTTKLVSGAAVDTYVTNKLSSIDGNYVHVTGNESVAGVKTFSDATVFSTSVSSPSYIGTGVYSTYAANTWSNSSNNAKLPTVATVRSAISAGDSAVTTAFQTADSGLQSQIDALNAGQNLADIVATKSALDTLGITNLQVGDKVQVLADETHDGASTVYNLTSTSPKTWTYIGKYGQDSYTKSEADSLFVENSQIKQSVDSTKQDEIPSSSAVSTYVTNQLNTLANIYVKLNSNSTQNINSALDITGQVDIDDVTIANNTVSSSGGKYGGFKLLGNDRATVLSYNDGSDDIAFIELDGVYHNLAVNLGEANNASSFEIARTVGATDTYSVTGEAVADYSDANLNAPVDGRLVTVDYLSSYTGDMSAYVKKTSSTVQNISSDLSITGDVDITGSLDVDNVSIDGFTITGSYVNTSGNPYSYKLTTGSPSESAFYIQQKSGTNTVASITLNGPGHASINNGVHSIYFNSTSDNQPVPDVSGDLVASYLDINGASLEDGRLTTVDYVNNKLQSISAGNEVGSIGLFLYTEVGAQKSYGETVSGCYLKPVGMSLPNSGQISYKSVATTNALTGTWKLLSVAMKRTATEPCLVLAQKIS